MADDGGVQLLLGQCSSRADQLTRLLPCVDLELLVDGLLRANAVGDGLASVTDQWAANVAPVAATQWNALAGRLEFVEFGLVDGVFVRLAGGADALLPLFDVLPGARLRVDDADAGCLGLALPTPVDPASPCRLWEGDFAVRVLGHALPVRHLLQVPADLRGPVLCPDRSARVDLARATRALKRRG